MTPPEDPMTISTQGEDLKGLVDELRGEAKDASLGRGPSWYQRTTGPLCARAADAILSMISAVPSREEGGPSCTDSGGSRPQEAVKSDGPRGLGGEG